MEQEQKRLLIRGARILNPARGEDYIGNILISGDRISAVSENLYLSLIHISEPTRP